MIKNLFSLFAKKEGFSCFFMLTFILNFENDLFKKLIGRG